MSHSSLLPEKPVYDLPGNLLVENPEHQKMRLPFHRIRWFLILRQFLEILTLVFVRFTQDVRATRGFFWHGHLMLVFTSRILCLDKINWHSILLLKSSIPGVSGKLFCMGSRSWPEQIVPRTFVWLHYLYQNWNVAHSLINLSNKSLIIIGQEVCIHEITVSSQKEAILPLGTCLGMHHQDCVYFTFKTKYSLPNFSSLFDFDSQPFKLHRYWPGSASAVAPAMFISHRKYHSCPHNLTSWFMENYQAWILLHPFFSQMFTKMFDLPLSFWEPSSSPVSDCSTRK